MPGPGPDQRDRSRNRRPRRRAPFAGGGRAPVTEYEEQQELEAAKERNDLEVSDLREMSVTELKAIGRDLELETGTADRKDELVDQILQRQTERAGHAYATGILDIVDEGFGFMRRHGLLP
ncbi:MAG: Transcription termination factor Rho, partial [Chloroflexota bacterium]|nr:Transcription termination factor Rho [Chloroflexota bacterium]